MDYSNLEKLVSQNHFDKVFEILEIGIPNEENELRTDLSVLIGSYNKNDYPQSIKQNFLVSTKF